METARPAIVTILGHVDHGKTSLLDFIRKSSVASKEHGGITQSIGAYQVRMSDVGDQKSENANKLITFIDTPGHAAFEKMRSRGAQVADIAVLVVAIDDGVMPQTVEAIKHILEAKVAMIVAVNKIDLPGINQQVQMEKIKKQLSDNKVLVEEYGGDVPIVQLSAKSGEGVDKLLELIQLVAEVNEIKGDPEKPAQGVVIEAKLDKFKGPIATVVIRNGTLEKNEQFVLGGVKGKVRGLIDYLGHQVEKAGPSMPVEILGLESVPDVGAVLGEVEGKKKETVQIQSLVEKLRQSESAVLSLVIKADVQGSLEAIEDALGKFNEEEKHVEVVSASTGDITEGDIKLAASVKAIVLGFNVRVSSAAMRLSEIEGVLVRTYNIIYELLDEMEEVVEGMLKVGALEEIFGVAQIVAEFPYGKNDRIAGCRVIEGQISKGPKIRVVRNEGVVGEGKIKSLKKLKDEVVRVERGDECGMMFDNPIEFQAGDLVQSYRTL